MAPDSADLGRVLLAARTAAGLRQVDVVASTHMSQARLSRVERGDAVPSRRDVDELLTLYRPPPDRAAEVTRLADEARTGVQDSRLVVQRGRTLAMQKRWRSIEERSTVVRAYQPALVHGLLQTPSYAAVVLAEPVDGELVAERSRRRRAVADDRGRRYVLLHTEGALRATVGSARVMVDQLDSLIAASRWPHVRLGVLPARRPMPFTCGTAFTAYDDTAVAVGLEVAAALLTDQPDLTHFAALFDRIEELAVFDQEARDVLELVRSDHRRQGFSGPS